MSSSGKPSSPVDLQVGPQLTQAAIALLELSPWVGSQSAQDAVDELLDALVSRVLSPHRSGDSELDPWLRGSHGRADVASVRASVARLHRSAAVFATDPGLQEVARATTELARALATFAEETVEASLQYRHANPRGDGPGQTIGQLRAAKQLGSTCRDVTERLVASSG